MASLICRRVPLPRGESALLTCPTALRAYFEWYAARIGSDPSYGREHRARTIRRRTRRSGRAAPVASVLPAA